MFSHTLFEFDCMRGRKNTAQSGKRKNRKESVQCHPNVWSGLYYFENMSQIKEI